MPTSGIGGFKARLRFSTAAGAGFFAAYELRDFNIDVTGESIVATSHDSSGDQEVIGGVTQWSGTANYLFVIGNSNQKALFDLLQNATIVDAEFFPSGSSSDGYYSGSCFITDWNPTAPMEDALAADVTFTGSGALTRSSSST